MRAKNTPNDPERRERIITATMEMLQLDGVTAVTARAVAARIDIPVGSVSYHFDSVRSLLLEASRRVLQLREEALMAWSLTVRAPTLGERLAELVHHQLTEGRALTKVAYELYLLGLRDEEFRALSVRSVEILRDQLVAHCDDARQAAALAATADGLQLQSLFDNAPPSVSAIAGLLNAVGCN
jgi:TetR/AcrR family transcriptional regulator, regulator of biofilm formation and stress response